MYTRKICYLIQIKLPHTLLNLAGFWTLQKMKLLLMKKIICAKMWVIHLWNFSSVSLYKIKTYMWLKFFCIIWRPPQWNVKGNDQRIHCQIAIRLAQDHRLFEKDDQIWTIVGSSLAIVQTIAILVWFLMINRETVSCKSKFLQLLPIC